MTTFAKLLLPLLPLLLGSCTTQQKEFIEIKDVEPWCIIGFDALERSPEQRMALLQELGLDAYGYNKGKGDLSEMPREFRLARENGIAITSVFLWLNAQRDSIGQLSASNRQILQNLKELDAHPTLWLSFSDNFFKDLDQEASLNLAADMIRYVKTLADELGCPLALYNHHGWFGNPYNQLALLEILQDDSITMVYNFHHAHDYVDQFEDIAPRIAPHLSHVNLNGMKHEGSKILAIGEGDHELEMIQMLKAAGYEGPWGILGHIESEDVQKVLERNMAGLQKLNSQVLRAGE